MKKLEIKIAVSGHRQLSNVSHLVQAIKTVVENLRAKYPQMNFRVFSCLAEGADRLLARELMDALPAGLTVVFPFSEQEYQRDFQTDSSRREFHELRQMAGNVVVMAPEIDRPHAYQAANRYLLDECDLLVTIWDGLPKRGLGGTAELVEMVRQVGKGLVWILSEPEDEDHCIAEEWLPEVGHME